MSQHDFVIDGGSTSRTTVRTDIQSGLQALASTSKGPTRPATVYQGQLWLDDNTPSASVWTLYLFDGADDIALGTFDTSLNTFTPTGVSAAVPTGALFPYAGATAPTGYLLCDGSSLLRASYADLFTAISTTYGSVDGTHFNIPDLRGRTVFGKDTMGGSAAGRLTTGTGRIDGATLGAVGGEQTHALTIAELAAHTHTGGIVGSNYGEFPSDSGGYYTYSGAATGSTGSGTGHNTVPPGIVANYIIKT